MCCKLSVIGTFGALLLSLSPSLIFLPVCCFLLPPIPDCTRCTHRVPDEMAIFGYISFRWLFMATFAISSWLLIQAQMRNVGFKRNYASPSDIVRLCLFYIIISMIESCCQVQAQHSNLTPFHMYAHGPSLAAPRPTLNNRYRIGTIVKH